VDGMAKRVRPPTSKTKHARVRAGGQDVFGHVEAYQVVWGGILLPPEM